MLVNGLAVSLNSQRKDGASESHIWVSVIQDNNAGCRNDPVVFDEEGRHSTANMGIIMETSARSASRKIQETGGSDMRSV